VLPEPSVPIKQAGNSLNISPKETRFCGYRALISPLVKNFLVPNRATDKGRMVSIVIAYAVPDGCCHLIRTDILIVIPGTRNIRCLYKTNLIEYRGEPNGEMNGSLIFNDLSCAFHGGHQHHYH